MSVKSWGFSKNYTYYNLCRVCLDCTFEKQAFNGLLKVISIQNVFKSTLIYIKAIIKTNKGKYMKTLKFTILSILCNKRR